MAVLETARGGLVLRGMGYESNEVSVVTNVTSDHLDLQGIHTLPELAEVKSTVARVTKPDGWTVLNADDPLVAAIARRVRSQVAMFSLVPGGSAALRRNVATGGRAYVVDDGWVVELAPEGETRIAEVGRDPDHDRRDRPPQRRERAGLGRRRRAVSARRSPRSPTASSSSARPRTGRPAG